LTIMNRALLSLMMMLDNEQYLVPLQLLVHYHDDVILLLDVYYELKNLLYYQGR
jgi:hypothetical protein